MAENRGKIFEREFRRGLLLLPGTAIRLYDGCAGKKTMRQPADFIYASGNEFTYLIECKSTSAASFPFSNIRLHQLEELIRWSDAYYRYGLFAIEYWRERTAFLIPLHAMLHEIRTGGRASLPIKRAREIGFEIRRLQVEPGFAYDLSFLEE